MKKILLFNLILMFFFASCKERDNLIISEPVNPELSSAFTGTDVVFLAEEIDSLFDTFKWTAVDYGFPAAAEYTLLIDTAGSNFANPQEIDKTRNLELPVTNKKINNALLKMGAKPGVPIEVEFKLSGTIHDDYAFESNVISISITPVEVIIEYPKLYIAGSFTPGWGFSEDIAIFSVADNGIYEGYIFMNTGTDWPQFQFSYEVGWVEASVVNDPDPSGTSGTLQVGVWGNNIYGTEGGGYYRVIANLNNLTYSLAKTTWGLSGDFNSWGNTDMTYDEASDTWIYTGDVTAGGFKFIANGAWGIYYGGAAETGILENPGSNIPIAADGNYTITLNLGEAIYSYLIVKN